jgi:cytochrome c oxidase cbb3-type subunit 2
MNHDLIEKRVGVLAVLIALVISVGGLVEIVPLYLSGQVTKASPGVHPLSALALAGRDVYVREGCYNCHSQMIRPLRGETERYGHYSMAGESVYDHPFQFGSKRTGPDLARVGGRYSDDWHRIHLNNPRDVVPESNMPGFPWLATNKVDASMMPKKMRALRTVGVPYTDAQIASASAEVEGQTEQAALITFLQGLGANTQAWQ